MSWRIYWYPEGAETWSSISLPNVTAHEPRPWRDVADAVGAVMTRLDRGGGRRLRIASKLHRVNDGEAWQSLQALEGYLRRGGRIALGPSDKMYLAFSTNDLEAGDSTIYTDGNVLSYDAATPGSSDFFLIDRQGPQLTETRRCSSVSGSGQSVILTVGLKQAFGVGAAVRPRTCYPVLYWPEDQAAGQPLMTDDAYPGLIYDLDIELEELPAEVFALAVTGQSLPSSTQSTRQGRVTLNEAVAEAAGVRVRQGPTRGPGGRWQ